MNDIAKRIVSLRKSRGLTQEKLGELLGISGQAVSKWENGISLPDIMLLPQLCNVIGVSVDDFLGIATEDKADSIVRDFCRYARKNGRAKIVHDVVARLFNDMGNKSGGENVYFGSKEILASDERGMGFVLVGEEARNEYLRMNNKDIIHFLRVLNDATYLSVIKLLDISKPVTREEIAERINIDIEEINSILMELMQRNLVATGVGVDGKRGYIQGESMVGVWMILAGCGIVRCGVGSEGSIWLSR